MTDKERLERIIQMQYDGYTIWDMGENDLVWLIEQAGRVQELEKENKRYKQALELIYKDTFYESENDLVSPIHVIRKRAEKALEESK